MVMDYTSGSSVPALCVVTGTGVDKRCDMSKSAIQAVKSLNSQFGIPLTKIAVTPMIGMNDVGAQEVFSLDDVNTLSQYVIENGLEGAHYWALDRDKPCSTPSQTTVAEDCFTYPAATSSLAFTNQFATALTTDYSSRSPSVTPTISPVPSRSPTAVPSVPPSLSPTLSPSQIPTISPSCYPTLLPSISLSPSSSFSPSYSPTRLPTATPSYSLFPSLSPSAAAITTSSESSSSPASSSTYWIIGVAVGGFIIMLAFLFVCISSFQLVSCFSSNNPTSFEFDLGDGKPPSSPSYDRLSAVSSTSFDDENLVRIYPNHRHEIALTTFESRV
jgi:hypothetical protein